MKKGISLVALVITIIVLIILTGTVVLNIGGENSIINKAREAKELHRASLVQEKEIEWKMNVKTVRQTGIGTEKTLATLLDELKNQKLLTEEEVNEILNSSNKEITIATKTISFLLGGETVVQEEIDFSRFTETHEEQDPGNLDIGIGTDNELVNLDLWDYKKNIDGISRIRYQGGIENGEIQGTVPAFIKFNGKEEFISVTNMANTFYGYTGLVTAPKIPSSVTNMTETFYGCTRLVTAPEIPSSVTNMTQTFNGCTRLVTAPEIPSSVTNMTETFYGCIALITVPTIPNSVTNMKLTFYGCKSLSGNLQIKPNALIDYSNCFAGASTNEGTNLKLVGNGTNEGVLQNLLSTKSPNSNISII